MPLIRPIPCPRCGAPVRIPLYWAVGIEGIFRCQNCRQRFKTGYKTGAFLSALALCLSMTIVQLAVYLLSIYTLALFALLLIPLWGWLAFRLRRWWMVRQVKRIVRNTPEEDLPDEDKEISAVPEPGAPYPTRGRLPDDTPFEEDFPQEENSPGMERFS